LARGSARDPFRTAAAGLADSRTPGIGKATLAYRIARYVLRYRCNDGGPPISPSVQ
jgi:hypothetical protein